MNRKELKGMIKPLIRECLTEIFMEMNLESIVEGVVNKKRKSIGRPKYQNSAPSANNLTEAYETPEPQQPSKEELRQNMMDKMGISESEWSNIYEDTIEHGSPILDGDDSDRPELVSESQLKQSGLFKDYSKFMK